MWERWTPRSPVARTLGEPMPRAEPEGGEVTEFVDPSAEGMTGPIGGLSRYDGSLSVTHAAA
ncbi:MAG: hypothetical protein AVDCRST_MAG19-2939 [uncultured Thermomicrobiales bacterium]|uniref:Uncharacterized protein n=1 Tax=uncultured Thermomicrobiales bacterium TaxID=1645740 RepID=A0A6J4VB71_9BACT|nr:MAG: hypothetical protein AVDCRST_MAG19-2939 [uncultured Thermomicrobiales bacterium]